MNISQGMSLEDLQADKQLYAHVLESLPAAQSVAVSAGKPEVPALLPRRDPFSANTTAASEANGSPFSLDDVLFSAGKPEIASAASSLKSSFRSSARFHPGSRSSAPADPFSLRTNPSTPSPTASISPEIMPQALSFAAPSDFSDPNLSLDDLSERLARMKIDSKNRVRDNSSRLHTFARRADSPGSASADSPGSASAVAAASFPSRSSRVVSAPFASDISRVVSTSPLRCSHCRKLFENREMLEIHVVSEAECLRSHESKVVAVGRSTVPLLLDSTDAI
jgi:hypothetical protein